MSAPVPTFEQMMALYREEREQRIEEQKKWQKEHEQRMAEADRRMAETDRKMRETDKRIAALGDRLGQLIESMVEGGVLQMFQDLGYEVSKYHRRTIFKDPKLGVSGEIDFFLENGDVAILVEVKANLSIDDIKDHMERLEKYRVYADARGDKRRFLAAVGGGVVSEHVQNFATKNGLYVIKQSGENVEIVKPEGDPKTW